MPSVSKKHSDDDQRVGELPWKPKGVDSSVSGISEVDLPRLRAVGKIGSNDGGGRGRGGSSKNNGNSSSSMKAAVKQTMGSSSSSKVKNRIKTKGASSSGCIRSLLSPGAAQHNYKDDDDYNGATDSSLFSVGSSSTSSAATRITRNTSSIRSNIAPTSNSSNIGELRVKPRSVPIPKAGTEQFPFGAPQYTFDDGKNKSSKQKKKTKKGNGTSIGSGKLFTSVFNRRGGGGGTGGGGASTKKQPMTAQQRSGQPVPFNDPIFKLNARLEVSSTGTYTVDHSTTTTTTPTSATYPSSSTSSAAPKTTDGTTDESFTAVFPTSTATNGSNSNTISGTVDHLFTPTFSSDLNAALVSRSTGSFASSTTTATTMTTTTTTTTAAPQDPVQGSRTAPYNSSKSQFGSSRPSVAEQRRAAASATATVPSLSNADSVTSTCVRPSMRSQQRPQVARSEQQQQQTTTTTATTTQCQRNLLQANRHPLSSIENSNGNSSSSSAAVELVGFDTRPMRIEDTEENRRQQQQQQQQQNMAQGQISDHSREIQRQEDATSQDPPVTVQESHTSFFDQQKEEHAFSSRDASFISPTTETRGSSVASPQWQVSSKRSNASKSSPAGSPATDARSRLGTSSSINSDSTTRSSPRSLSRTSQSLSQASRSSPQTANFVASSEIDEEVASGILDSTADSFFERSFMSSPSEMADSFFARSRSVSPRKRRPPTPSSSSPSTRSSTNRSRSRGRSRGSSATGGEARRSGSRQGRSRSRARSRTRRQRSKSRDGSVASTMSIDQESQFLDCLANHFPADVRTRDYNLSRNSVKNARLIIDNQVRKVREENKKHQPIAAPGNAANFTTIDEGREQKSHQQRHVQGAGATAVGTKPAVLTDHGAKPSFQDSRLNDRSLVASLDAATKALSLSDPYDEGPSAASILSSSEEAYVRGFGRIENLPELRGDDEGDDNFDAFGAILSDESPATLSRQQDTSRRNGSQTPQKMEPVNKTSGVLAEDKESRESPGCVTDFPRSGAIS